MFRSLTFLAWLVARVVRARFLTRSELLIENLALRQQVLALKRERPRPVLDDVDRAFWVALRASWRGWVSRLIIVDPDTVTRWYRERFRRHRDAITAMDFFTVPAASLRVLYALFVIEHGRRRVVHCNVTFHPISAWVIQQLRESFPFDSVSYPGQPPALASCRLMSWR